jgi:hypothetical protein
MTRDGELIILNGLEGNVRADVLTTSQQFLLPYVESLKVFWAIVFFGTLLFLLLRFVLLPLLKSAHVIKLKEK